MKFKKGDKIQVRPDSRIRRGIYAGKTGVVQRVYKGVSFPYTVSFTNFPDFSFHANELIKVEK